MKFNKVIYVERGMEVVSVLVSGRVTLENGKRFVSEFEADYPLRQSETELAKEELIERAACYPETGQNE